MAQIVHSLAMAENFTHRSSGEPFADLVKKHPTYGPLIEEEGEYEVWIVHTEEHWFLIIKRKDLAADSPCAYMSLEIMSHDCQKMDPEIRRVQVTSHDTGDLLRPQRVGIYGPGKTLLSLCELADSVVKEMDGYNFINSNCQHFCNNLLIRMGFHEAFPTMVGPNTR